jgi:GTPase SAR1 family protein
MVDRNTTGNENDLIYRPIKIVVIGDGAVGKTSLIKWYPLFFLSVYTFN